MLFSLLAIAAILSQTFQPSNCQSKITISPPSLTLTPTASGDFSGATFSVSCEFAVIGFTFKKVQLTISRLSINSSFTVKEYVAIVDVLRSNGAPFVLLNTTTVEISGSLEMGFLNVTFTKPDCKDEGVYGCSATASKDMGGTAIFYSDANLKVIVTPGPVTLTADPDGVRRVANERLTLVCKAIVGFVENASQVNWVWQYRNGADTPWESTQEIGITQTSDLMTNQNLCYYTQSSTLTRYLSIDDNNRQYRCYVQRDDLNEDYSSQAASFVLGVVFRKWPLGGSSNPSAANASESIGWNVFLVFLVIGRAVAIWT